MRPTFVLLAFALTACGARPAPPPPSSGECEACLASGGTWQASRTCTHDCSLMDVSCFRDHCPGPCSAEDCGACERADACEAAGCSWQIEGEAMWCR